MNEARGRGLFIALEVDKEWKYTAKDICMRLMDKKVLSKPTHFNKIRFSPPLVINQAQTDELIQQVHDVLKSF